MARGDATRTRILDAAQQLVLTHGFAATTVDAVLAKAAASKGAFFHHFSSKADLGRALVERYAANDSEALETFMAKAEERTDNPAEQLVHFVKLFEDVADDLFAVQPGCLFVSFIYEYDPGGAETRQIVTRSVLEWRHRIVAKLRAAKEQTTLSDDELTSLADQVFTIVEGAFLLAKALDDPTRMRAQLAHLRRYLQLLFDVREPSATA